MTMMEESKWSKLKPTNGFRCYLARTTIYQAGARRTTPSRTMRRIWRRGSWHLQKRRQKGRTAATSAPSVSSASTPQGTASSFPADTVLPASTVDPGTRFISWKHSRTRPYIVTVRRVADLNSTETCRISEEDGCCPICQRKMKKVRKIFTVWRGWKHKRKNDQYMWILSSTACGLLICVRFHSDVEEPTRHYHVKNSDSVIGIPEDRKRATEHMNFTRSNGLLPYWVVIGQWSIYWSVIPKITQSDYFNLLENSKKEEISIPKKAVWIGPFCCGAHL